VAGLLACLGFAALAIQLERAISFGLAHDTPLVDVVARFFSFFTILTNLGVAILLARAASTGRLGAAARRWHAAAASYILVVGAIYELFLRRLAPPRGLGFATDMVLHDIMPLAFTAFWIFCVRDGSLRRSDPLRWLAVPLAYFAVIMGSGLLGVRYPYYFVDAGRFGYAQVTLNALSLLAVFLFFGVAILLLDRARRIAPADAP
jgi:hypothetical protein